MLVSPINIPVIATIGNKANFNLVAPAKTTKNVTKTPKPITTKKLNSTSKKVQIAMVSPSTPKLISNPDAPLKVLIVDDNDINLKILSRILSKHFSHLIKATSTLSSGVSALDILKRNEYDLIFLDIDMPVLSGVETTIEIRRGGDKILESNRKVPIIAVTTNTLKDQRKVYTDAGMNGCVGKPICLEELKNAIELAIGVGIDLKNPEEFSATLPTNPAAVLTTSTITDSLIVATS